MTDTTEILCSEYGSRALGIHNEHSDRDYIAIHVEAPEFVTGTRGWVDPSSQGKEQDVDTTVYPLRKWASLACNGNPNVIQIMFSEQYETLTEEGSLLLAHTDAFLSQKTGRAYLSYMKNRRDTVEKESLKSASHYLRLGMQGIELMSVGRMSLPMEEADRDVLISVRKGEMSLEEILSLGSLLEKNLQTAIDESELPEMADRDRVDAVLHDIYESVWSK